MRVMNIDKCNLLNGEGCRIILWVSHCEHNCPFCHNGYSWNENLGELFNENHMKEIYEELSKPYISGITFSGGDPLSYKKYKDIIELSKQLRKDFPNKTQWLWTGYTYEELMEMPQKEVLETLDVLCDGKFKIDLLSPEKHWVGSSNQRVIDVQKTLEKNEIVLYED